MSRWTFVGGGEWEEACGVEADLMAAAGVGRVLLVAAAAASLGPARRVERGATRFGALGVEAVDAGVLHRSDAMDPDRIVMLDGVDLVYLGGGSAQHLRSVMSGTPWWRRLCERAADGLPVVAAQAAATVCCSAMLDDRGGGFGVGLGPVDRCAVVPEAELLSEDRRRRIRDLAPDGLPLAWVPTGAAVTIDGEQVAALGDVRWTRDGSEIDAPLTLPSG